MSWALNWDIVPGEPPPGTSTAGVVRSTPPLAVADRSAPPVAIAERPQSRREPAAPVRPNSSLDLEHAERPGHAPGTETRGLGQGI